MSKIANNINIDDVVAEAKQIKETALTNAKLALEEMFVPRLQSIISSKIQNESEDPDEDEENEKPEGEETSNDEPETTETPDGDPSADDVTEGDPSTEETPETEPATEETPADASGETEPEGESNPDSENPESDETEIFDDNDENDDDDLEIESIIKELENDDDDIDIEDEDNDETCDEVNETEDDSESNDDDDEDIDLDEILKELNGDDETEEEDGDNDEDDTTNEITRLRQENSDLKRQLGINEKKYAKIQGTLSEVNMLNAKLLYTNKLFKSFNLNQGQKMKVVETFDRAKNIREVKLLYTSQFETLKENVTRIKKTANKITEGIASKPSASTKPHKIINEHKDVDVSDSLIIDKAGADRLKKLANIKIK